MPLHPGDRIELDHGESAEVATRPEPIGAGIVGCEVRGGEQRLYALLVDPRAPEALRHSVAAQLRAMRLASRGALGPVLRARHLAGSEPRVGYRDAAASPELESLPVVFFSLAPTTLLARLLTPSTRIDWPANVVARLAVEIATSMTQLRVARIDPFCVGLDAGGAWLLEPGLDTLLRTELRDTQGLRSAVAWMGYLAPEAIRRRGSGEGVSDQAAALHGLGVLLHELLMGEPLYGGETPLETLIALRRGSPPSLTEAIPEIPLDLAAVVHALLDHDPLRRPDPRRVVDTLAPIAAPDLSWADALRRRYERPLDFLRVALRHQ